jgi:membrane-bound serine protease (ClpP class)
MTRRLATVAVVLALMPWGRAARAQGPSTEVVYRVPVRGPIEPAITPFVQRSLDEARDAGAVAVILDLDTPGGSLAAAVRIAEAVSSAEVPVYALVSHRALAVGALVALSTRGVFMRPASVLGAAPRPDGAAPTESGRLVASMRRRMRAAAEAGGLDPRIAEAMVDRAVAIPGVVAASDLLTLTADEAARVGYAAEVDALPAALASLGHQGARVVTTEASWAEQAVRFLSHPVVAPFLLSLAFLGLLAEIRTPKFGMAGAAALLALALFFGSHIIVGLAGTGDVALFGVGLLLLGLEVFVVPGFGIVGVLGIVGILTSVYLSLLPGLPTATDFTRVALVLASSVLVITAIAWAMAQTLPGGRGLAPRGVLALLRRGHVAGFESPQRRQALVGREGTAITDLRPSGTGFFDEQRIDVVSESEWIPAGTPVRIVSDHGYRHVVRPTGRVPPVG